MRSIRRLLLLCFALLPLGAFCAESGDALYRVVEPLPAGQADAREEGLRRAFDTLVLRLTGDPKLSSGEALAALRQNPQPLILQFGYQDDRVEVQFDAGSVQQALRRAGVALWSGERPRILGWWLLDRGVGAQLVGDAQDDAAPLQQAARHSGLPMVLPLADLSEQLAVTPEVLAKPAALTELSARYPADAQLAVLARESEGSWQADWHIALGADQQDGKVTAASLDALAGEVMSAVQGWMTPKFRAKPGQAESLTLIVENNDIGHFAETTRLLQPLGARLVSLERDRAIYRLDIDPEQLRAQLALSPLHEVTDEPVAPGPIDASQIPVDPAAPLPSVAPTEQGSVLRYRW